MTGINLLSTGGGLQNCSKVHLGKVVSRRGSCGGSDGGWRGMMGNVFLHGERSGESFAGTFI